MQLFLEKLINVWREAPTVVRREAPTPKTLKNEVFGAARRRRAAKIWLFGELEPPLTIRTPPSPEVKSGEGGVLIVGIVLMAAAEDLLREVLTRKSNEIHWI